MRCRMGCSCVTECSYFFCKSLSLFSRHLCRPGCHQAKAERMSNHENYLMQVAEVIRELFYEYDGPITMETTARDVPQWDSLSHVRLIVLIEQELGVRFSTTEMEGFKNLGSLIDAAVRQKG